MMNKNMVIVLVLVKAILRYDLKSDVTWLVREQWHYIMNIMPKVLQRHVMMTATSLSFPNFTGCPLTSTSLQVSMTF
jgi:ADP-heptose:LPS heptosyltransferase